MEEKILPQYPVYIISKGRSDNALTARCLIKDGVPFHLVVEPQEHDAYAAIYGEERIYALPFSNLGLGSIPARNWVKEHATAAGQKRHWILDDNIRHIYRRYKGKRLLCNSGIALTVTEDFVERYENIAIAGLNYHLFAPGSNNMPPFHLNHHVYSCLLILNELPFQWRGRYNEDTDLCLQVLANSWCTVLMNAFLIGKVGTMTMKGGNSTELYKHDGRLKMARSLERLWPGVVETRRRFRRPQHFIKNDWRSFDTPLIPKMNIQIEHEPNEYGMKLVQVKSSIRSIAIKELMSEYSRAANA